MKKLILSAAIVLGSLTAMNAQTQASEEQATPAQTEQAAPADQAAPAEQAATEQAAPASDDAYTAIKNEEIPAAVTEALKQAYPEAVINRASVNSKKEYQLEVKVGDKEGALFADENGKWIQK